MTNKEKDKEVFKENVKIDGLLWELRQGNRSIVLSNMKMSISYVEYTYRLIDEQGLADILLTHEEAKELLQKYVGRGNKC